MPALGNEVGALHQPLSAARYWNRDGPAAVRAQVGDCETFLEVKLAAPVVVKEPIGHVGSLLDLADDQARPERMHGPSRCQEGVAVVNLAPVEEVLDGTIQGCLAGFLPVDGPTEPKGNSRAGIGPKNVPHFRFAQ